jgi:hypothetical protein
MSSQPPQFLSGDFEYRIINETTVRVTCGDFFDVAIPIRDLDRGIARYMLVKHEYERRSAEVVPLRGHAARS